MVKKVRIKKKIKYLFKRMLQLLQKNKITAKGFVKKHQNCKEVFSHLHTNAICNLNEQ